MSIHAVSHKDKASDSACMHMHMNVHFCGMMCQQQLIISGNCVIIYFTGAWLIVNIIGLAIIQLKGSLVLYPF